ncbi:Hint domain-containing protein [Acetobacter conturbans]|uniref:Hedgehog/Intein (Hint) domain-containing protein n=1 Tax=Acetobacter conturbans TaxID=1737472 RepID=A0ABX0K1U4_9PROT|nr:Hint domain-containing protein [Acetobacter conturbans]NHN89127.1 hypothetical protein [Acetobacter conturbans]
MATTYWNSSTTGDFYDPANWSDGEIPQSHTCESVDITGASAADPAVAIANAASYGQIHSLTIGDYGTLKITAAASSDDAGYVFSTYGLEIQPAGELIIDTAAPVELGLYTENRGGTITIMNNPGNVVLDGNSLNGTGTLNLVNSTLGSAASPVSIGGMGITLQGGSTLYTGWDTAGASVTFDPATVNTLVLDGNDTTVATPVYGVSENSHFAINGADGVEPTAATFVSNNDGSYSLVVSLTNGHTVTLSDIVPATGFVPGTASISQDAAGDWLITDTNAASVTPDYSASPTHAQLQQVATDANATGAGTSATTTGYSNHSAAATDNFIGTGTATNPASWDDSSNWSLGEIPQTSSCYHAALAGTTTDPLYVVASQADVGQFVSLSVNANATLTVTAPAGENPNSYVFTTAGFEIRGNGVLNIDTAAKVELGGVSAIDGTLNITGNDGNVIVDGSNLSGAGTINLTDSTLGSPDHPVRVDVSNLTLNDGSTYYASLYGVTNTVTFDNSDNTVVLNTDATQVGVDFENVNANTHFGINVDSGTKPTSAVYTKNDDGSYTLTIALDDGKTLTLSDIHTADGFVPGSSSFTQDAAGDWIIDTQPVDVCFLEGSLIQTTRGAVAVEDIIVGDEVVVLGAEAQTRPVIWVGMNEATVKVGLDDAEAGYPVRIRKDALAENVPSRDLLVTSEHCLFLDGAFVPVRMLVNGASISYDRSISSYRYFHVETEAHSVILAENTPTESYLDTGNRRSFIGGQVVSLTSRHLNWADAAAPLMTQRDVVEGLHRQFAARAVEALGLNVPARASLTRKPELVFQTEAGTTLRRLGESNGVVTVEIPENITVIHLRSRASRPSDVVGPFVDDRRLLGVLVGDVVLQDGAQRRALQGHLDGTMNVGWHAVESGATTRWTNGDAVLDLGQRVPNTKGLLKIRIAAAGPYVIEAADTQARLCA